MGFFAKTFGPKPPAVPPRNVAELAKSLARPGLQAKADPLLFRPGIGVAPHSWFLGEPALAAGVEWPERDGRKLEFLGCIDLADARAAQDFDWLPAGGNLSFFYDFKKQPYGTPADRGGWAVLWQPGRVAARSSQSRAMSFHPVLTYPPPERPEADALGFSDAEWDLYCNLETAQTGVEYCHKLGGYQSLIQGDGVELECQFASHDLAFNPKTMKSERGLALASGAAEWRLLLQVASDKSLGFMWGDAGNLYFMIREADARAGRFDAVWLISQCF